MEPLYRNTLIPYCTAKVSEVMFAAGAFAPRTRYVGRQIQIDPSSGQVVSGTVKTACSFLTGSGFEREVVVPVIIRQGQIVDPTIGYMDGRAALLSRDFIQGVSDAGTIHEPLFPGHMYSTAYAGDPALYRQLRESLSARPRIYRPMF